MCVDAIVDPSGSCTISGVDAGCLLLHGTSSPLKCPVAPVSAIALVDGGEEPRV